MISSIFDCPASCIVSPFLINRREGAGEPSPLSTGALLLDINAPNLFVIELKNFYAVRYVFFLTVDCSNDLIFALVVFILNDQVRWFIGLVLAVGNMLGAWIASRMAVKRGSGFMRWILITVVAVSAVLLLGNIR